MTGVVTTPRAGGADLRLAGVAVLTGLAAGVGGVLLTLVLHLVQHVAFGYTEDTFLAGVQRASPERRVLALTVGGVIVGLGWYALRRWASPVVGVESAMKDPRIRLPVLTAAADGGLQIIAVGAGASLGREGAPRQVGAALAGWLADRFGLDDGRRRVILACGAGAGLACVYDVPLGGALFTCEILLRSAALRDVVPALLSSAVATAVGWPLLSDRPTYVLGPVDLHPGLMAFGLILGPLAGLLGAGFLRLADWGRSIAPTGWRLPVTIVVVFAALGLLAGALPQLLGNGKGPAQLALGGGLGVALAAVLLFAKPVATAACLASGARGGLLTPAVATGAVLGAMGGSAWSAIWPGTGMSAFAMIGAAAVLATTQRAPLCAIVLVLEFTRTGVTLLAPIGLAVAGALLTASLLPTARSSRERRPADGGPA